MCVNAFRHQYDDKKHKFNILSRPNKEILRHKQDCNLTIPRPVSVVSPGLYKERGSLVFGRPGFVHTGCMKYISYTSSCGVTLNWTHKQGRVHGLLNIEGLTTPITVNSLCQRLRLKDD